MVPVNRMFILAIIVGLFSKTAFAGWADPIPVVSIKPWPTSTGSSLSNIIDGSQTTGWDSNPCRAGAWMSNNNFNLLFKGCSGGLCSGSCSSNLTQATDNSPHTAGTVQFNQAEGRAWASIPFASGEAKSVFSIYIRGAWPPNTMLYGTTSSGQMVQIATLGPQQTYLDLTFPGPSVPINGLYVQSVTKDGVMRGFCYSGIGDCKTFTITEVGVQLAECYEEINLNLGSPKVINRLDVRFNGQNGGMIATSVDDLNYVNIKDINTIPSSYFVMQKVAFSNVTARYVRFR
jgi:hypothetical protein